ncbi:type II secretion system protein GspJ [Candidatus Omnitrophota bacterium]
MQAKRLNSGFTFVEILLVTAMLSVIGLSIYATFNSGINLWLRINKQQSAEDVNIFFEKISHDLRNSFKYTDIVFRGRGDEISFPVVANFQGKRSRTQGIGKVDYIFDRGTDSIKKRESNYSEAYKGKVGNEREVVSNIESLSFRYYYYDPEEKQCFWVGSWQEEEDGEKLGLVVEKKLPLAVRIAIEVKDGRIKRRFQRTVFIPAAYHTFFKTK